MPRKGHSEEEMVRALRLAEGGQKVSDICREMGVSQGILQLETALRWIGIERVARATPAATRTGS